MYIGDFEITKLKTQASKMQDRYFKLWQKNNNQVTRDSYLAWQAKEQAYQTVLDLMVINSKK